MDIPLIELFDDDVGDQAPEEDALISCAPTDVLNRATIRAKNRAMLSSFISLNLTSTEQYFQSVIRYPETDERVGRTMASTYLPPHSFDSSGTRAM